MIKYFAILSLILTLAACDMAPSEKLGIDYHTHIWSPELGKEMSELCGILMPCETSEMAKGTNAKDLMPILDTSRFNRAAIMSGAYLFGSPEFKLEIEDQVKLTRVENQFIADQVATSEKLFGFFSSNPIADYAIEEARYWKKKGGFDGMKLHMAMGGVDFFNPDHIQKLQNLFDVVDDKDMTILIHLQNRNPEYDDRDVEVFINDILPHVPNSTIIIAHAINWGNGLAQDKKALDYFIKAMNEGRVDTGRTYIGVGAILKEGLGEERQALFLEQFRSLNIKNWVFGSDWTAIDPELHPVRYSKALLEAGMTTSELDQIISKKLPFVN